MKKLLVAAALALGLMPSPSFASPCNRLPLNGYWILQSNGVEFAKNEYAAGFQFVSDCPDGVNVASTTVVPYSWNGSQWAPRPMANVTMSPDGAYFFQTGPNGPLTASDYTYQYWVRVNQDTMTVVERVLDPSRREVSTVSMIFGRVVHP